MTEEKAEIMPGLSRKETDRLLDHIERQGVTITKIKSGVMLRMPDGESTVVHYSVSDHRGPQKLRAQLKRSGITWPTDPGVHRTKSRPSKQTIEAGFAALASMGWPAVVTTRELVMAWPSYGGAERERALQGPRMAQGRFLTWAGFDLRGKSQLSRWVRLDDEAKPETFPPAERHAVLAWTDSAADAEIEIADGPAPELTIVPVEQIEPDADIDAEVEPDVEIIHSAKVALRNVAERETVTAGSGSPIEIIAEPDGGAGLGDVAEDLAGQYRAPAEAWREGYPPVGSPLEAEPQATPSWAAWKDLPGDWTIDQVRLMLLAFGLDGELRVWRDDH